MKRILEFNPFSCILEYNEHKCSHMKICDYPPYNDDDNINDFIDYDKCVELDEVFSLHVHPDNSLGFYTVRGSDINEVINSMCDILKTGE